ncbi:MAG: DUF4157 domain-containing protein [Caldilineaceae bacterium]
MARATNKIRASTRAETSAIPQLAQNTQTLPLSVAPLPKIQRKTASPHGRVGGEVEEGVGQTIRQAKGRGSRLDTRTRGEMESAFGAYFGGVRVHTDAQSDTLNRSLNARAFTTGNDIFFRQGEYSPESSGGKELLAHELTHTVQQGAAPLQRKESPGTACQCPSCATREGSARPEPHSAVHGAAGGAVQRTPDTIIQRHHQGCGCASCSSSEFDLQRKENSSHGFGCACAGCAGKKNVVQATFLPQPAPPSITTPTAQPGTGSTDIVQRHSSFEHYLLGQVEPDKLAEIPFVRQAKQNGEEAENRDAMANVRHTIIQEMERLNAWREDPEAHGETLRETSGQVEQHADETWQVPIVVIPVRNGETVVATYSEINALPDMFGNLAALENTPKQNVVAILQGIRQQTYIELNNLFKELFPDEDSPSQIKRSWQGFAGATGPRAKAWNQQFYKVTKNKELNTATSREGEESQAYFGSLTRNACHFAPESWSTWRRYHEQARGLAEDAWQRRLVINGVARGDAHATPAQLQMWQQEEKELANRALLANAFGEHYLQDSFAAGHLIDKTKIMQFFLEWLNANGKKHWVAREKWAMISTMTSQNLTSNPQALENLADSPETPGAAAAAESVGMAVQPEIRLMMWWRHQAAQNHAYKHLTPDKVVNEYPSMAGYDNARAATEEAQRLMNLLVQQNFCKIKQDKVPGTGTWSRLGRARKQDVYSLDEAQVNVVKENGSSAYKSRVAANDYETAAHEFNLESYQRFLNSALLQGATGVFHDKFCVEGLEVRARNGDQVGFVYGDNKMLSAGVSDGVAYQARTSKMSREAVFKILNGYGDDAASADAIEDRFPGSVISDGGEQPLDNWNDTTLRQLGEDGLFEEATAKKVKMLDKSLDGLAKQHTLNIDGLMGPAVEHDGQPF